MDHVQIILTNFWTCGVISVMTFDERQQENDRILITSALAHYQPAKTSDGSERAIFSIDNHPTKRKHRRITPQTMHATSTRNKGVSRLNCSENVFEHLKVQRTIKALSPIVASWLVYRYGENPPQTLLPLLIEAVMDQLPLTKCRKKTQQNVRLMLTERLSRREFDDCLQRHLFESMGVSEQAYYASYAKHNTNITKQIQALDQQSLLAFFQCHNDFSESK